MSLQESKVRKALKQCYQEIKNRHESGAIYKHGTVMFSVDKIAKEDISAHLLVKHYGNQGLCEFFLQIDTETTEKRGFVEINLMISEYATCLLSYERQKRTYVEIMETIDCVFPYFYNPIFAKFDE